MAAARKTTKPAAKSAAKSAPRGKSNRWATVQLPEGFTPITSGEFGEPWDFEKTPVITGTVVGDIREVESGKGRDKRVARVITIEDEDSGARYDVWDSAALRGFFDRVEPDMRVSVAFQGYRDTGKASPMKVFVGAIADDEAEDEAPARKPARKTARKTARR